MAFDENQDIEDLLADDYPTRLNNAEIALDLAERGLRVFPIVKWSDGDWTPIKDFPDLASKDASKVRDWWVKWPNARVGLLAGEANGITVLDIDVKNGKDGLASLAALGVDLEASPVRVRTPSGGWHLFFAHEPRMKNWVGGSDEGRKLPDGLDCRNDRGFIVAPGSRKGDGYYDSVSETLGSCKLPSFPESLIPPPEPERAAIEPIGNATEEQREWAAEKLVSDAQELAGMQEGEGRNSKLNALAMWAGGAAAHGFLDEDQAREILWEAAKASGLRQGEFKSTFRSGWTGGLKKPIGEFPRDAGAGEFDDLPEPASEQPEISVTTDKPLFFDVGDWDGLPVPEREWLVDDLIPMGTVTLLYGDGGNGKSLLALQLAAAVASGDPWIGAAVRQGKALFLSAEDSDDELHRRMIDVANADGNSLASYRGNLLARSLVDGNPLLAVLDKTQVLKPSDLYKRMLATVKAEKPALLVLDTLGNLFPGNENDRAQVTQFAGLLKRLAEVSGCAVLLLAHPSKSGMATGSGDSGSTAWNGNVRSRFYLDKVVSDGVEMNPKLRRLTHLKANYGSRAQPKLLEWHSGVFRDGTGAVEESSSRVAAKFLEMVATYEVEGKALHPRSGPTYAPRVLADDTRSDGYTKAQFKTAMNALLESGSIDEFNFKDSRRYTVTTLRVIEDAVAEGLLG